MKFRTLLLIGGATAAIFVAAACGDDEGDSNGAGSSPTTATQPASAVKDALLESVNEEYKAHATYQGVVDKLGDVGPFSNIVKSEQSHIDAWKRLLTKYGVAIPADPFLGNVTVPATLKEACAAGAAAEKDDIALYDGC